jgi:hypothetical protein
VALATPACSLDTDALIALWDGGPPDAPRPDASRPTDGGAPPSDAGVAPDGG